MPSYELLAPGVSCGAALPLNAVQDTFSFLRFASLTVVSGTGTADVVIPRDTMAPEVMDHVLEDVRRELPYKVDLPVVRGGIPMFPRFDKWKAPLGAEGIERVEIPDRRAFLRTPRVVVDGVEHTVDLTTPQIDDILARGSTIVQVGRGSDAVRVQLRFGMPEPSVDRAARVDVHDVNALLDDPVLTISEHGRYRVNLDAHAIGDLLSVGVARVTLASDDRTKTAYLVAGDNGVDVRNGVERAPSLMGSAGAGVRGVRAPIGTTTSAATMSHATRDPHPAHLSHPGGAGGAWSAQALARVVEQAAGGALPKLDVMLALPYQQTWELLGYSRGELVNTISLGPQEETTVEVFTWDRRRRENEQTTGAEQEGVMEVSFTDKHTMEVVKELTSESDWNWDVQAGVTIPVKVPVELGAGFESGGSITNADRLTRQLIEEATRKASSRVRATRQTKVTESSEVGREERVTRRLKNPNMCRTLSLDFFEVMATYQVTTSLVRDRVRLCVAVPAILADRIDRRFLLTWEGVLSAGLLSSDYERGFAAARTLAAADERCALTCSPPCRCSTEGNEVAPEPAPAPGGAQPGAVEQEMARRASRVIRAAAALRDSLLSLTTAGKETLCGISYLSGINPFKSEEEQQADDLRWAEAKAEYHRWLYWKFGTGTNPTLAVAASAFLSMDISTADKAADALEAFVNKADRSIFDTIVAWLREVLLFPVTQWKLMLETLLTGHVCLPRMAVEIGLDSAGLPGAMEEGRNAAAKYREPPPSPEPADKPVEEQKDETETVAELALSKAEIADLATATVDEKALIWHIQANESYYRQLVWRSLDRQDRLRLLSLYGDLAKHVEPEVLGFLGNAAILPYRVHQDADAATWLKANVFDDAALGQASAPYSVTVPTRGLVTETRLGSCDGCEDYIIQHRALELRLKEAEVRAAEQRAKQEELETQRYQQRLANSLFDDPDPHGSQAPVRIAIRQETTEPR